MIQDRLLQWTMSLPDGPKIESVNEHVEQLAKELYCEYEPTRGPHPDFWHRLEQWLDNVDEPHQKILFRLLKHLFFIGPRELDNLYRVAYNYKISSWIIEDLGLELDVPDLEQQLRNGLSRTWFCPITDSMRINAFYHLNHISGSNYRPDWFSLAELGSPAKIANYVAKKNIQRLVLLEDFVGSGSQIEPAVIFAASMNLGIPILVLPLVVCPAGETSLSDWQNSFADVTCDAVLRLRNLDFLTPAQQAGEPDVFDEARPVVQVAFDEIQKSGPGQLYGPYGFSQTGSLVVLSTNCPDNTLPLIHFNVPTWAGLFPRASRL